LPSDEATICHDINTPLSSAPLDGSLVQIYGQDLGKRWVVDQPVVTIGRGTDNDIIVDDGSVSRFHAKLLTEQDKTWLVDLGSTNGSLVDGQLQERCALQNGVHIKIGSVIFKYLSGGNAEALYHEELYRMAIFDGLTGLHNRRYFNEFLERELARALRHERNLAVALLDIDHFKSVNDKFGHQAGDHVLEQLARVVSDTIRREELFARYGGEEFAIVLPEQGEQQAMQYCQRVRGLVDKTNFAFDDQDIPVTVSIGLAIASPTVSHSKAFVEAADAALYRAKREGRNRVCG